jgi:predicted enzyme related to lactoylglutathione lyase
MNRVVGFEISSKEPEVTTKFFEDVFGWEVGDPNDEYWPVLTGKGANVLSGGIAKGPKDHPHGTRIQIEVDSIDETLAFAKVKGAEVVREKMEFDTFYLAYLKEPTGIGIGLIEQK